MSVVGHDYTYSLWEAEAGGYPIQGHFSCIAVLVLTFPKPQIIERKGIVCVILDFCI